MNKPKPEWTLEDYREAIADCRSRAAKARQSADGWDAQAEQLRREAAQFSTEKLPLFQTEAVRIECTPEQLMQACQYLYYVGQPAPIWTDYQYDKFCQKHGLDGSGGSDRQIDYPPSIVRLAAAMKNNPLLYPPE